MTTWSIYILLVALLDGFSGINHLFNTSFFFCSLFSCGVLFGQHKRFRFSGKKESIAKRKRRKAQERSAPKRQIPALAVRMDLPDEELKQPLVETQQSGPPPVPSRSPQHGRGGAAAASPKRGSKDIARGAPPNSLLHAINNQKMATNNYVAMRNPSDTRVDEEKDNDGVGGLLRPENIKQQLPYAAPNVHPYAVPQYQSNIYGDRDGDNGNGGWGASHEQSYDDGRGSNIDLAVSGMYTLAAAFTVIQGFGMLIHFTPGASTLCTRFSFLLAGSLKLFAHVMCPLL